MRVSAMVSLVFCLFAIGSVVGGDSLIGKRDVSELIGNPDHSQLARTSSRLTNKYLPPQSGTESHHAHHLSAPVDISSKSGDFETTVDNSHYDNHSQISTNGINQPRAEFKSTDVSANGLSSPSTEFKSETNAGQYDNQNQFPVNGISQTKSTPQYETEGQLSVNGEVAARFREDANGLPLQNTAEVNNRNSEPFPNYLPPQSQTLPKPIRLSAKSGDIGTTYVSPVNDKLAEQLFTSNPESSSSSSNLISSGQQLPVRSFEPNSFSQSTYGTPTFQQQRPDSFSPPTNAFKTYGPPSFQQQRSGYPSRIAQDFNGAIDLRAFQPVPTAQTNLAGADAQTYNYRVALQNGVGQVGEVGGGKDVEFLGPSPQLLQQKRQFGYEVQGSGNFNDFNNLKSGNGYRYSQPQNDVGVLSNYQQNGRASSSSLLTPSSTSLTENQNIPQAYRSTFNELRSGSLSSGNGYRYQNPDLGVGVEAAGNQQISDYQRRPSFAEVTSRQNYQVGIAPDLVNARFSSAPDSSYPINAGAAYKYVRPAIGLGVQNLEARFQPQSQPLGVTEVSQRITSYDQPSVSRNGGDFGVERSVDLENGRLRSGLDSSNGFAAYKYVRPAIGLGAQTLEDRIQPETLSQRINTYDRPSIGGSFGAVRDENFSAQATALQPGSGQSYDSSGGYVY